MARPIAYGLNLLESGTVTVTGEAAGQGKERLYDRDRTLLYVDSGITGTRRITVDQGGSILSWDTWIVALGHNLTGITLTVEVSDDMSGWSLVDTFAASSAQILRTVGSLQTHRGVRLNIPSPASPPSIPELLFSRKIDFPVGPSIGGLEAGVLAGVSRQVSRGGYVWKTRRFGPLWSARYTLEDLTVTDRDALLAFYEVIASGAKPFFLADHDGTVRWVEWENAEAIFHAAPVSLHRLDLDLQEVV